MKPLTSSLEFIVDDPRFLKERPYALHVGPNDTYSPSDPRLSTIRWEAQPVTIHDARLLQDVSLERYGFMTLKSDISKLPSKDSTEEDVEKYQLETEETLKNVLGAEKVLCYDYRRRKNGPRQISGTEIDINHPSSVDLPPRGAHNITFQAGPEIIKKVLKESGQMQYLSKKYRFRIVNTWRPLVPKLEDRPLAFCDYRTVNGVDLLACDQIYSKLRTEIYYLKYNPEQRWYWFSEQTPKEILVMLMYDTMAKEGAKFCPHVSFRNPEASPDAPLRESIETRNVVITLASDG